MIEFRGDDPGYLSWTVGHPTGFILNVRREPDPSYVVLHRARDASAMMERLNLPGGKAGTGFGVGIPGWWSHPDWLGARAGWVGRPGLGPSPSLGFLESRAVPAIAAIAVIYLDECYGYLISR
jgi:hypothetical protein